MVKKERRHKKRLSAIFLFFIFFVACFYFRNLTGDIYGGDVGDLVTASYVFGVAHPPGYPLFTLLGFFLTKLPFALLPVTKVAVLSLFSSLLSLYFFRKIIKLFIFFPIAEFISLSILAFSYLFWLSAEIPEVFALHILLSCFFLYEALLFYKTEKIKYLFLSLFAFGLAASNHHTIVLLLSTFFILVFARYKILKKNFKKLLFLPLVFLLGLFPYAYIPFAASKSPVLNWDNAVSLQNFIRLVTRADYGTFTAGAFQKAGFFAQFIILKHYFLTLVSSITLPALAISFLGFFSAFKKDKIFAISLLVGIILSGPVFLFYAGFPILNSFVQGASERFFLMSQVLVLFFFPFGLTAFYQFLTSVFSKKIYATSILLVFFILPILLFKANVEKTNLSKVTLGTDLSKNILRNLTKNSWLILQGDTGTFNTVYVQHVLGFRPDIELVQVGNFGLFSKKFEKYYKNTSGTSDKSGFGSFFETVEIISDTDPVFSMVKFNLARPEKYTWIPRGLVFELIEKDKIPDILTYKEMVKNDWKGISIPIRSKLSFAQRSLTISDIPAYYAGALINIGVFFYEQYKDFDSALTYIDSALNTDPAYSKSYAMRALLYLNQKKCEKAEKDIQKAISLFPTEQAYYVIYYRVESNCFKNVAKQREIELLYNNYFKIDIKRYKDISK